MEQSPQEHPGRRFRQHLLTLMGLPAAPLDPPTVAAPRGLLSDRERTVLRLLHGTLSNAEIAATLSISPNTLKTHIRHLYRKLGTTTRDQAITRARELGLAGSTAPA
jgi:LuxR family maltose regulon positive regulatory protein